jgi:hypothetical protein
MHTDSTLRIFDEITTDIGAEFRSFVQKICPTFDTRELSREVEARKRRNLRKAEQRMVQNGGPVLNDQPSTSISASNETARATGSAAVHATSGPKRRTFNIRIYKYHALGDYPNTIRRFGTTDSFSTEPVRNYP